MIPFLENKTRFLGCSVSWFQKLFYVFRSYLVHITKFPFHVFLIDLKLKSKLFSILLMESVSFSDPRLHKIILRNICSIYIYVYKLFQKEKTSKIIFKRSFPEEMMDMPFINCETFWIFRFSDLNNNIFKDDFIFLVFFKYFGDNWEVCGSRFLPKWSKKYCNRSGDLN